MTEIRDVVVRVCPQLPHTHTQRQTEAGKLNQCVKYLCICMQFVSVSVAVVTATMSAHCCHCLRHVDFCAGACRSFHYRQQDCAELSCVELSCLQMIMRAYRGCLSQRKCHKRLSANVCLYNSPSFSLSLFVYLSTFPSPSSFLFFFFFSRIKNGIRIEIKIKIKSKSINKWPNRGIKHSSP